VRTPLVARDKRGILRELSAVLATGAGVPDRVDEIRRAIEAREALLSTGVGHGIALPHARTSALGSLQMAVGTTVGPVDFDAVDESPVRLVWMLAAPASASGLHVRTLARISGLLREASIRERLVDAGSPQEFLEFLREVDAG
jgi:mannitol/fructose-specific phosphotransferase system IIA component (Ntr-type)